jgi:two-component system chemotaxis sensor kinase CheA
MDDIKSVRVDVGQLDDLHGLVEQLVTSRIKLRRAVEEGKHGDAIDNLDELDKITTHLQDTVMDMRLIPLKKVVSKFPRLVRDLAREEDKTVEFVIEGEDIELDRTILTQISDPLMHILRNAVDHGIEPPDEREAAGKPREGRIELRATRERDHVIIEVEDDGQGLDEDAIRAKARENGVVPERELESMSASDVYDLVFHPGFSTSEEVTDVSGRGVGMDVVHSTVKQLDGSVNVESDPGEGTTVRLRLPVTVAIVTVLFVRVGDHRYGIPIKAIDEISRANDLRTINGQEVVEHDDEIYPVIKLDESLDIGTVASPDGGTTSAAPPADEARAVGADDEGGMLLRIRKSERQVALYCDEVEDQEEVVVKPLEGVLSGIPGLSGTAVLGDGNIVPILDVVTL